MTDIFEPKLWVISEQGITEIVEHTIDRVLTRRRTESGHGSPELGALVRDARQLVGYSQTDLAACAGLDHSFISRVEQGQRGVGIGALAKLEGCLGAEFALYVLDLIVSQEG
jgi:ribosome-binding protein aMBF1 (putative translation factor)